MLYDLTMEIPLWKTVQGKRNELVVIKPTSEQMQVRWNDRLLRRNFRKP